jgi:hypothetical protein
VLKLALLLAAAVALSGFVVVGALVSVPASSGPGAVPDIPAGYLELYRSAADRYALGDGGWSYLAAVGKVECDHGRSPLPGCRSGSNSAGAQGPAQFLAGTWSAYGVDGDGDGDRDVYDPADAIHGMANYLRASAAPRDWDSALFAYNHARWYVDRVVRQAASYRAAASGSTGSVVVAPGQWLVPLPGFPGERCDARIVGDVVQLVAAFGIHVSDCYGGAPHALDGEHPLGLAIDASPVDGDWRRTELLARRFGWRESCARQGCPGAGPFRVVLYNGYPGHGDSRHTRNPHLHLSWDHGPAAPFSRAPWVRVVLPSPLPRGAR